jgi:DNA-binding NtrC family response regulator
VESAAEAMKLVVNDAPDLILADLADVDISALELLAEIKKYRLQSIVALMSATGTIEIAVEAMRLGASDFVVKPLQTEKLRLTLMRMVESFRLSQKNELFQSRQRSVGQVLPSFPVDLEGLERLAVQRVFEQVAGNKEKAQKLLGISRATLYRKIKRYGIQSAQEEIKRGFAAPSNG